METLFNTIATQSLSVDQLESYLKYFNHLKNDLHKEHISTSNIASDLHKENWKVQSDMECITSINGITEIHDVDFMIRNIRVIIGSFSYTRNSWAYTFPDDDKFDC
jgi:vacuolar-type H+-ATPase catalytic subunit A/Vma1